MFTHLLISYANLLQIYLTLDVGKNKQTGYKHTKNGNLIIPRDESCGGLILTRHVVCGGWWWRGGLWKRVHHANLGRGRGGSTCHGQRAVASSGTTRMSQRIVGRIVAWHLYTQNTIFFATHTNKENFIAFNLGQLKENTTAFNNSAAKFGKTICTEINYWLGSAINRQKCNFLGVKLNTKWCF